MVKERQWVSFIEIQLADFAEGEVAASVVYDAEVDEAVGESTSSFPGRIKTPFFSSIYQTPATWPSFLPIYDSLYLPTGL